MGRVLPREVMIQLYKSGMSGQSSVLSSIGVILMKYLPWRGHQMGRVSLPVAVMPPCRYGTPELASAFSRMTGIPVPCLAWCGRPMGRVSLPAIRMEKCRYGMQVLRSEERRVG